LHDTRSPVSRQNFRQRFEKRSGNLYRNLLEGFGLDEPRRIALNASHLKLAGVFRPLTEQIRQVKRVSKWLTRGIPYRPQLVIRHVSTAAFFNEFIDVLARFAPP